MLAALSGMVGGNGTRFRLAADVRSRGGAWKAQPNVKVHGCPNEVRRLPSAATAS